jgi:hypothetical protein
VDPAEALFVKWRASRQHRAMKEFFITNSVWQSEGAYFCVVIIVINVPKIKSNRRSLLKHSIGYDGKYSIDDEVM